MSISPALRDLRAAIPEWSHSRFNSELGVRVRRGLTWSIVGGAVGQSCTLLTRILTARILGKLGYGHVAGFQSVAAAAAILGSLGMGVVATKYVSECREDDPGRAGRILGLAAIVTTAAGLVVASAMIAWATRIATVSFGTDALAGAVRWTALYSFFAILNGYQGGAMAGLEAFRSLAHLSLLTGLTTMAVSVLLSHLLGETGAIIAFAFSGPLTWACFQHGLRAEMKRFGINVTYRNAWRERDSLSRFALPASYSGMLGAIAIWWSYACLVRRCGFSEIATFSAVTDFRTIVLFVPRLLVRATTPVLNQLCGAGQLIRYRLVYRWSEAVNLMAGVFPAVFLILAGPSLLKVFGKDFVASRGLLLLAMLSAVLESIACHAYQTTFAHKTLWWQAVVISTWSLLLVVIAYWAIPIWGAAGLAAAYATAWTSSSLLYICNTPRLGERTTVEAK